MEDDLSTSIESQMDAGAKLGLTPLTLEAIRRGLIQLDGGRIVYHVHKKKSYSIADPEEEVRADTIAFLVLEKGYDAERIETEVIGAHDNYADVVLYRDKRCTDVWLVVEDKKRDAPKSEIDEGEAQAFANSVALKATYALLDYGRQSALWQVEGYGAKERERNRLGDRDELPENYSEKVSYALYAGGPKDIAPADSETISTSVRRAHSIIWAGGKRDPLSAFDEWSKLMFAKVRDERYTPTGAPRGFQVGVGEPDSAVATRVHGLFAAAKAQDDALFPADERIELPDNKIAQVVRAIEGISFMHTDSDVIGTAFEDFFGSVFRGGLGQYFTMRPVARFVVAMLGPKATDFVLDPTCGSGGFLLETLLQVWNEADAAYAGQGEIDRVKGDFALKNVFGIEIHPTLARICKISLLLHHDGHTNIEADKSCLSGNLENPRLRKNSVFDIVVGNPPFGTKIERGDDDQLDGTSLDAFVVGRGRNAVQSEQVILERSVGWLKPGGLLGMVIPDGVLNNAGPQSNCPAVRDWLFRNGRILAVVSLPDFAFRRSGASNKTSVLVFGKYAPDEAVRLANALEAPGVDMPEALTDAGLDYEIFFAEASHIGYTPSGRPDPRNDLYTAAGSGLVAEDQAGSILGAWERWSGGGVVDDPRCVTIPASEVWASHKSHRIDPKYHVYKAHARDYVPKGWSAAPPLRTWWCESAGTSISPATR